MKNKLSITTRPSLTEGERNINGTDLIFHGICLTKNKREILQDVFGAARQGDMLALMGPSGSGKTSLLNAIAGRLQIDSGEVLANGVKFTKSMRRQMCYVLQQDIFFPMLTLKETLTYWAFLKLPDKMPWKEKKARVNEIIDALDLGKCTNTIVGDQFKRGLSGGEKKRANIACELLTNPALMLMDEPTSGLDSTTAHQLMVTMKRYTKNYNKTVITAIHQPSSQTFHAFDKVLLLCGGKVAYYGRGSEIIKFFESIELPCQPHYNPADFILDKVKSEETVREKITTAGKAIAQSDFWLEELKDLGHQSHEMSKDNETEITKQNGINGGPHLNGGFVMENGSGPKAHAQNGDVKIGTFHLDIPDHTISDIDKYYDPSLKYQTSFLTQFGVLFVRNIKQARHRIYEPFDLLKTGLIFVIVSLLWFQLEKTEEALKDRQGVMFFVPTYTAFMAMFDSIVSYPQEQAIILKERRAGAYHLSAYFFSKFFSETILFLPIPLISLAIMFWAVGLNGVTTFFCMWGLLCLEVPVVMSVGFTIAVAGNGPKPNLTPAIVFTLFTMLAGGFYITRFPFWLGWIKYLSVIRYVFDSFVYLEFTNAPPIRCAVNSSLSMFEECRLGVNVTHVQAERFLETMDSLTIWQNVLCLCAFMLVFKVASYLILRFIRCPSKHT